MFRWRVLLHQTMKRKKKCKTKKNKKYNVIYAIQPKAYYMPKFTKQSPTQNFKLYCANKNEKYSNHGSYTPNHPKNFYRQWLYSWSLPIENLVKFIQNLIPQLKKVKMIWDLIPRNLDMFEHFLKLVHWCDYKILRHKCGRLVTITCWNSYSRKKTI